LHALEGESLRQIKQARPVEQPGLQCRPTLQSDAASQNSRTGSSGLARCMAIAGQAGVVGVVGFDVERNPVDQRQHAVEPLGIYARRVQPDLEPLPAHFGHRCGEAGIRCRFAAGKDHAVEQAAALLQHFGNPQPAAGEFGSALLQMRIVAITATPRTALDKHYRDKFCGPVERRERDEAADCELFSARAWPAPGRRGEHIYDQFRGERQRAGSTAPGSNGSSASSVFLTRSPSSVLPSSFSRRVKNNVSGSSCRVTSFQ
jgi:hypothetical protein